MILHQITTPNGIKANRTLNKLSEKLNKKYKNSNIKVGFEIGFYGNWELIINNTKTDRAMVLKENGNTFGEQQVYLYTDSFINQQTHNKHWCVNNEVLGNVCNKLIPLLSK